MTAITRQRGRTALAAVTALSLGVLGALATGVAANATSIDTTKQGQIIIHKHVNPGGGTQNPEGTGGAVKSDPIAGVVFEYCSIQGINLFDGTNTGWTQVKNITTTEMTTAAGTVNNAASQKGTLGAYTLTGCVKMPATDAAGVSTSAMLPLGAYFVREITAPANVVAAAPPFIVTLPTPKDGVKLDGDWVYNVNVYPKNTIAGGPVKNVVKQDTNGSYLGAPIAYEVTQKVPALAAGQTYTKFSMTDTLDTKLTPVTTVPVTVKAGGVTFVSGTDYTATWAGQKLTVVFTPAGLAKLVADQIVVFGFTAKANAVGALDNTGFVNINDFVLTPGSPNDPNGEGSPSTKATTRWGDVIINKINSANKTDKLAGAQFEVYQGTTETCTTPVDITGLKKVTLPTGATYVGTSDASGKITIPGLWVGDTEYTVAADGTVSNTSVAGHDFKTRCYILKEISAPNGFVLPGGAAGLTPIVVSPGAGVTLPVDVENTQQDVPELPFTGSNVQIALTIGGIALLIIALGGVMVVRRRNATRQGA